MTKNVGSIDKVVRIIIGAVLIIYAILSGNWWGLVGIVPLLTAFVGYCPVYSLIKISTVKKIKTEKLNV
ncbi:MAG: DUF2892 domain-containing protein [Ignavibacterium sp.]